MADQAKRNWADIEDDEDHHQSKPVEQSKGQAENVEYKLQATGESIPNKEFYSNRQQRAPKKPLLSYDEMISEIQSEQFHHKNVFIHCFGVNGTEAEFRAAVEPQVKFINLIEHKNDDRENSIDLKFDDKGEAVKFIQVGPKIQISGKTFRIKFGKVLKNKGEFSKFGDNNNERRQNRDYRDRNETDKREYRSQNTFQKKQWNDNKEESKTEEQEGVERPPALPFKPRGFINSKKEAHLKEGVTLTPTINQESEIKCVDMNAKIVEKQKTEEHHYIEHQTVHHAKEHHHHDHPKGQQNDGDNKKEQNKKPHQTKDVEPKQNQKESQQPKVTQPKQNHKEETNKSQEVQQQPKTVYVPKNPQVKEVPKQKEEVPEPKVEKKQQEDEWTTVKSGTKKDKPSEEKKGKTYQPQQSKEGKKTTSDKVQYERKK